MEQQQMEELKASYYEYIANVPTGLRFIYTSLQEGRLKEAFDSLANLAEGLESLLLIEQALQTEGVTSNSRLGEAVHIYEKMNVALSTKDYEQLLQIMEQQLIGVFASASEWQFSTN